MRLHVVYARDHFLHADPRGRHPADPRRLEVAMEALRSSKAWELSLLHEPPAGEREILYKVHDRDYVEFIETESADGFHYIDRDTYVTEHTFSLGLRFFHASWSAAQSAIPQEPWLLMARPGGHHAGRRGWAMGAPTLGFCIFNHAASAAMSFAERGLRTMVIDFDAHHGNGTQDIFWEDPRVIHVDIHQRGIYPGTGDVFEIGGPGAEGTKINVPLEWGSGDAEYAWIADRVLRPLISLYRPQALVLSAGFDAFAGDPLTRLSATEATFEIMGSLVREAGAPAVAVLEGGYGEGLGKGLRAFVEALMGLRDPRALEAREPRAARELRPILSRHWGLEA